MRQPRVIFVFGSNLAGRHAGGAARDAAQFWGAQEGVFFGETGESYAIPTVDSGGITLPLDVIARYVRSFIAHACNVDRDERRAGNQRVTTYYVTPIGCGIAGYSPDQIAPLFLGAPWNVQLPSGWREAATR